MTGKTLALLSAAVIAADEWFTLAEGNHAKMLKVVHQAALALKKELAKASTKHGSKGVVDDFRKLARADDPSTSKEAAAAAMNFIHALQQEVYDAIKNYPDRTATELARRAKDPDRRTYNRRVTELLQAGVITVSGIRACKVTGRNVRIYRVVPT